MTDSAPTVIPKTDLLRMTAEIVAAYVGNNSVSSDAIQDLIKTVFNALGSAMDGQNATESPLQPAIAVKKSITAEYIICLEDGKKLKMMKRYLRSTYGMSPDEYRAKWGLPPDYPMVAPNYAKQRSAFAKKIGLGRGGRRPRK